MMLNKEQSSFPRGFLPAEDPLKKLSAPFEAWEDIAHRLPKLLLTAELRATIANMPLLSTHQLSPHELERAMMLLSFLGHAYVWGDEKVVNKIPASLALPWYEVANKLERPPVLSYASYALHNWQREDLNKPIALGNISLLQNFFGGLDEEWFVLVHVDIECKAASAISALPLAQQAAENKDHQHLFDYLKTIQSSLLAMCSTLDRMPEGCDPYIYYNRVRPYIHGWKDNPALPDGMYYEGVSDYQNQPQQFRGETGAQSTIIPCLDAVFGITHEEDLLRKYLHEMRDYMPKEHRQFLNSLENRPSIRQFVSDKRTIISELCHAYNACVELIFRFRETHLRYAATYINKQAQTSLANPTETGTGGTPFMLYLRKHKQETKKFLL